jgi:DNA-directed RNA polymerase specialized sigma24 family protein
VSKKAWACFEGRLVHGRPASEIAVEQKITPDAVHAHTSRVRKEVRDQCAKIAEELGDDIDLEVS